MGSCSLLFSFYKASDTHILCLLCQAPGLFCCGFKLNSQKLKPLGLACMAEEGKGKEKAKEELQLGFL